MLLTRRRLLSHVARLGLAPALIPLLETAALGQITRGRVRQNIAVFARSSANVAALRAGVKRMQQRSRANADDPLGWTYWANIHGTDRDGVPTDPMDPSGNPIYSQCKHSDEVLAQHFLSWHRPYLALFEMVLKQAAKEAGNRTEFELPYWNWYAARTIPAIYTQGNTNTNPLFHRRARNSVSGLSNAALSATTMLGNNSGNDADTFSYAMEINPHGRVHDLIGGEMGSIDTSARDPIFWLHHANVDRLWSAWMKTGAPDLPAAGSSWGNESWYYNTDGSWNATASASLDSEAGFGYHYDDEVLPVSNALVVAQVERSIIQGVPAAEASSTAPATRSLVAGPATISATRQPITLGSEPVSVQLAIAPQQAGRLRSFAEAPASSPDIKSASIVLEDIELGPDGKAGGFSYDVVASLPGGPGGQRRRVVIDSIGSFSLSLAAHRQRRHMHGAAPNKITLTYPLAKFLKAIGGTDATNIADGVRITLEPAHPPGRGRQPAYLTIGSIKLNVSPQPAP